MSKFNNQSRIVRVACVQHVCEDNINKNVETAIGLIKEAVRDDADIVCLQELFSTRYFAGHNIKKREAIKKYAEKIDGPIVTQLQRIAKEAKIVLVGGSIYESASGNENGHFYNSAPIIDVDGTVVAVHRKAHIPNDPGYMERRYFDLGSERVTVAETQKGKVGVGICFDQWFPEVALEAGSKGAEVLLYPTSIGHTNDEVSGYIPGDSGLWNRKLQRVLAGQAANNHLFVGIANRIGIEDDTRFFGESCIYDFNGDSYKRLGCRAEGVSIHDCDFNMVHTLRKAWGFDKARRDDL